MQARIVSLSFFFLLPADVALAAYAIFTCWCCCYEAFAKTTSIISTVADVFSRTSIQAMHIQVCIHTCMYVFSCFAALVNCCNLIVLVA